MPNLVHANQYVSMRMPVCVCMLIADGRFF